MLQYVRLRGLACKRSSPLPRAHACTERLGHTLLPQLKCPDSTQNMDAEGRQLFEQDLDENDFKRWIDAHVDSTSVDHLPFSVGPRYGERTCQAGAARS